MVIFKKIFNLIKSLRTQLSGRNITSPDDISNYFYNSIKNGKIYH